MKTIQLTFFTLVSGLFFSALLAQELVQKVRGSMKDDASEYSLPGVLVSLISADTAYHTVTDIDGNFLFSSVIPGRYKLKSQMLGYQEGSVQDIQVTTGKELSIDVFLSESVTKLNEVVVKSQKEIGGAQNKFALVSSRGFTVEEAQKYPGSFEDPARMASAFSGVASDPSGTNDIIVRGNSPRGILWRIEGVEAPNPNHFGGDGATGGGISMIASPVLANSDFYTSAFPAEFGNATSGVFDIRFRRGNNEKREYSVDLNTLGARVSAEGPFKKGKKASYLAHYRYSTLGLLDRVGVVLGDGGTPKYQDAAFKVFVPTKNVGYFTGFGLFGESNITFDEKAESNSELIVSKGKAQSYTGIVGLNHFFYFNPNTYLKSSLAVTGIKNQTIASDLSSNLVDYSKTYDGTINNSALKFQVILNKKINSKNVFKTGVFLDHFLFTQNILGWNFINNTEKQYMDIQGSTQSSRAFAEWSNTPHPNWQFVYGVHFTNLHLNGSKAIDPRLGAKWNFHKNQKLSFGIGFHSRHENLSTYFVDVPNGLGSSYQPNLGLGLSRSFHVVLGHEIYFNDQLRLKSEVYYQNLFSTIVEDRAGSPFSMINSSEGFINKKLKNGGAGYNYGIEFTLERFFYKKYFFLVTTSLSDSKYRGNDGRWRNSRYNTNVISNLMVGKEFDLTRNGKQRSLTVSTKAVYSGGQYYIPIDLEKSVALGSAVYNEDQAFNFRHAPVTRLDLQIKFRANRKRSSHEILLDIQNFTNNQTTVYYYYSDWDQSIKSGSQLQMVPLLGYKVTF
jgi:CarboxypepD_reg-like domain